VSGTVSVKDLKRKIDPKAAKELHKSQQAAAKGDRQKVIEHLRRAIDRDPAYMEAYNNLGAAYMQMNEFGRAVNEFQKAVELVPDSPMANSNLTVALYSLKRYPEAERAARQALKANPQSKRASLVLGMSLALEKRLPDEALDSLERAAPLFPRARLAAADLLAHQGQRDQAIEELKRYLKSGKVEDRQSVETWLAELQAAELPH
jgi:superkiller protein 3